jgi:hypothetical protein
VTELPADVFQRVRDESEQRLWIPGEGEVDMRVVGCQRVCREYDDRLVLARHELTGDWVVFIKISRDNMYPVIGIGRELCDPEELSQRLWKADAKRHGSKLLYDINEHNERLKRESRKRAIAADEEIAEAFEWGLRQEGVLAKKVFVPGD